MKKYIAIASTVAIAVASLAMPLSARADVFTPSWDVTGSYTWTVLGTYAHDLTLTQNSDGSFTGIGGYPAGTAPYTTGTTEAITGQVTGAHITFTTTYAGPYNPGYTVTVDGTIAADGSISGNSPWPWTLTGGSANLNVITDWGSQLSASQCSNKGKLAMNVTQKVVNDPDSGTAGNNWATDNFNRHIQVWKTTTDGVYCALVLYEGNFNATPGEITPAGTGTLSGTEMGTIKGGYRAIITGALDTTKQLKGNIGTVDYSLGNQTSWLTTYFPGYTDFDQVWWGWIYYAGDNGTWVNSSEGNFGNIY